MIHIQYSTEKYNTVHFIIIQNDYYYRVPAEAEGGEVVTVVMGW